MVAGHQLCQTVRVMCINSLDKLLCDLCSCNVLCSHAEFPSDPPDLPADHADLDLAIAPSSRLSFRAGISSLNSKTPPSYAYLAPGGLAIGIGTVLDEICFADFNYFGFQFCVTLMPFSRILAQPTILYTCLIAPAKMTIAAAVRDSVARVTRRSVACHPMASFFLGRSAT
jgi:hypothetical protein